MGFGTSAAAAIIFTGVILLMGVVVNVVFETYADLSDAALDVSDSEFERQRTRISIANSSYTSSTVYINATNTGETYLDTSYIDLLLNGTIETEQITKAEVAGTSSKIWGVHENLYIEISYTGANNFTRIMLITQNGVSGGKVML
jgi:archaellum component FlaF (FlaF/FlaG flagellin family)